ncbi:MAG: hypothetical protein K6A44_03380 [bacterium]|nr:hypothetical protein [bacterium]
MLLKGFDYEEFKEEYLRKVNYNTYLVDDVDFETEMDYLVESLDEDKTEYNVDTDTINDFVASLHTVMKKICGDKLQNRSDNKDIMVQMEYIDTIKELFGKNLSQEELQDEMYVRLSAAFDQAIETVNNKAAQKELFKIEHPNLSKVNRVNLFIIYCIVVLIITVFTIIPILSTFVSTGIEGIKTGTDVADKIFSTILGLVFPMLVVAVFIWQVVIIFKKVSKVDKK